MSMLLLAPCFIVVLFAVEMHQIQLIHQAALFQKLQRTVHGDTIDFRISFFCKEIEAIRVQMPTGPIDQIEEYLALTREAHPLLLQ